MTTANALFAHEVDNRLLYVKQTELNHTTDMYGMTSYRSGLQVRFYLGEFNSRQNVRRSSPAAHGVEGWLIVNS